MTAEKPISCEGGAGCTNVDVEIRVVNIQTEEGLLEVHMLLEIMLSAKVKTGGF